MRHGCPFAILVSTLLLGGLGGCTTALAPRAQPLPSPRPPAELTAFEMVGIIDFRRDSIDDYRALVQPGDLIVNTMRLGRAAKTQQWLFAILPHGHSMIVLDPSDLETGILECRFHGVRRVGVPELKLHSYNTVYRLRDAHRLNLDRLREFADLGCDKCKKYSFKSWLAFNDNLTPDAPAEISDRYTCSTMVAAAYHYAGVTLEVSRRPQQVITPLSVAGSAGAFNAHALSFLDPGWVRLPDSRTSAAP